MIAPSAVFAAAINARLSGELRRRLRARAGASVALHCFGLRMCFRIGEDGRWRAASPLIDADTEMRLSADGGDFHISGDGALLRDLDEVRRRCAPREQAEEMFGAEIAEVVWRTAEKAKDAARDLPMRCGVAASPAEVAKFVRETAAFDGDIAAAAARLARLERRR